MANVLNSTTGLMYQLPSPSRLHKCRAWDRIVLANEYYIFLLMLYALVRFGSSQLRLLLSIRINISILQ